MSTMLEKVLIPTDGNCLFTALTLGFAIICGKHDARLSYAEREDLGVKARAWFLKTAKQNFSEGTVIIDDLTWQSLLLDHLWDTPEAYIAAMSPPITHRSQWGGFAEARAMAHKWNAKIGFFRIPAQHR